MKILQRILSHGLLIGFFVASFFTYLYRAELFPQWFGDSARSASTQPAGTQTLAQAGGNERPARTAGTPVVPATDAASIAARVDAEVSGLPPVVDVVDEQSGAYAELPPRVLATAAPPALDQPPPAHAQGAAATGGDLPPAPSSRPLEQASPEPPATYRPPASQQATATYRPEEPAANPPPPLPAAVVQAPPVGVVPSAAQAPGPIMDTVKSVQTGTGATVQAEAVTAGAAPVDAGGAIVPQPASAPSAAALSGELSAVEAQPAQSEATDAAPADDFQQQLATARGYFWRHDLRGAVQAYQGLTRAYSGQADAWGELGNLYLSAGQREAAADAYFRAINLLLDQGDAERAYGLLRVLYSLDRDRASEIEKRFRQMSS